MSVCTRVFVALAAVCMLSLATNLSGATTADEKAAPKSDGTAEGKKSLGGSGEMLRFSLPEADQKVSGIRVHGARYGVPKAPDEKFLVYFLNADGTEILSTQMAPYSLFERGDEKWVSVPFKKPVTLPKDFWVVLDFRAGATKGVYVSYDTSTGGKNSKTGLPGIKPTDVDFGGDWMIDLLPVK